MITHWFTQRVTGGFPIEKAAIGVRDLSVLSTRGEWQWLVKSSSLAGRSCSGNSTLHRVTAYRLGPIDPRARANVAFGA